VESDQVREVSLDMAATWDIEGVDTMDWAENPLLAQQVPVQEMDSVLA
jgi:hypothetical protein